MPTTLSYFIFLTVIKLVILSYMYSYLTELYNDIYCMRLIINLPAILHLLFLDFLAILINLSNLISYASYILLCESSFLS